MEITPEESEAYRKMHEVLDKNIITKTSWDMKIANALLRHVAAEMRLEFDAEHRIISVRGWRWCDKGCRFCHHADPNNNYMKQYEGDIRHGYDEAAWERAADEALRGGKADG